MMGASGLYASRWDGASETAETLIVPTAIDHAVGVSAESPVEGDLPSDPPPPACFGTNGFRGLFALSPSIGKPSARPWQRFVKRANVRLAGPLVRLATAR